VIINSSGTRCPRARAAGDRRYIFTTAAKLLTQSFVASGMAMAAAVLVAM
jgi:hypothetical protein